MAKTRQKQVHRSVSKSFLQASLLHAPSDLQLPLRQWNANNIYRLVLSKAKM